MDDPDPNNDWEHVITDVEASPPLHVQAVQVTLYDSQTDQRFGPSFQDYRDIHLMTQYLYPVSKVTLHRATHSIHWDGDYGAILSLLFYDWIHKNPGPNTAYVGLVPDEVTTRWDGVGFPSGQCWVKLNKDANGNLYRRDNGLVAAHEMGHTFWMFHVNCGGAGWPYEPYPYARDQLSRGGPRDYYGFDSSTSPPTIKLPLSTRDIMGYCQPWWISDYTFKKLRTELGGGSSSALRRVTLDADTQYLMVMGTIDPATQVVSLMPMVQMMGDDLDPDAPVSAAGEYAVRLLAADDSVLAEEAFDLPDGVHQEEGTAFSVLVPYDANTARVVVVHQGAELSTTTVSPNPPTVALNPVSGTVPNPLTASWTATDADGDTLSATLFLSADGGKTWNPITAGIEDSSVELDTMGWPGTSEGMLRIKVSDGVHTVEDTTGPFTVPLRPPEVYVMSPSDGATLQRGMPAFFSASGYDAEDGPLADDDFQWRSDRDGDLGSGEEILAESLSAGLHEITVRATDSDGLTASDTIHVFVGYPVLLPLIRKEG